MIVTLYSYLKHGGDPQPEEEGHEDVSGSGHCKEGAQHQPPEHRVEVVHLHRVAQQRQGRQEGHGQGHSHGEDANGFATKHESAWKEG